MRGVIFAILLFGAVLSVPMVGCAAAWISYQDYQPSPNICRSDEMYRTDCVRPDQTATAVTGVAR